MRRHVLTEEQPQKRAADIGVEERSKMSKA
jgi:hypothetical protein